MKTLLKILFLSLTPIAILVGLYSVYLVAGGEVAREDVKAYIKQLKVDADYTINSHTGGGDCEEIGEWDSEKLTCTLKGSLDDNITIRIASDNLVLDGNNQLMNGLGDKVAIYVINQRMVTIKRFKIVSYQVGVYMQNAKSVIVSDMDISKNTWHGIVISGGSDYNVIRDNNIGPSTLHGIAVSSSHGNQFISNSVTNNRDGIRTMNSHGNVFVGNVFTRNRIEGLDFHGSSRNLVFYNSFITDGEVPLIRDIASHDNTYFIMAGGNYYSIFDEAKEGCNDLNTDGLCDKAFEFGIVTDRYPFVKKDGWK